jgi:hypothetical protein
LVVVVVVVVELIFFDINLENEKFKTGPQS